MKTVILTSSGWLLPEVRREIIPHLPRIRPLKVLYIPTAAKVVLDNEYAKRDMAIMHDLGFHVQELDVATCKPDELERGLRKNHVVYVQGGNGFYLLKHAQRSGFAELAKKLVNKGRITYVGKSAGSYLACPSLEMHTWHSKKWHRYEVNNLTAMHLVDFLVQAHYSEDDNENIIKGMAQAEYPIKLITNKQLVVVKGKSVMTLGEKPEFIYKNGAINPAAK